MKIKIETFKKIAATCAVVFTFGILGSILTVISGERGFQDEIFGLMVLVPPVAMFVIIGFSTTFPGKPVQEMIVFMCMAILTGFSMSILLSHLVFDLDRTGLSLEEFMQMRNINISFMKNIFLITLFLMIAIRFLLSKTGKLIRVID
jgi:hypothetical protein